MPPTDRLASPDRDVPDRAVSDRASSDRASSGGSASDRVGPAVAVLALLTLSWWLRSRPLAPSSLWLDDLWVVAPSQADGLSDAADMLVTTPLFTAVVNAVYAGAGPSSLAAQAIPFAAGVAGVGVAVAAARAIRWCWPAALVTGLVVAVAPEHVVHSSRVKQYTLEALLGLVAVALAWRVVERRSSAWTLVALACATTSVSASAGVFAGATLAAATLVRLLTTDRSGRHRDRSASSDVGQDAGQVVAPAAGFAGFAVLWWALYLRSHVPDGLRDYWREDFLDTGDGLGGYVADLGGAVGRLAAALVPLPAAWSWVAAAAAVVLAVRPRFALVLATPVVAAVVLATLQLAPIGTGRTDVYLLPSVAFAVGAVVDVVDERARGWTSAFAVALVVALVGSVLVRDLRPTTYPQHDVRPLIEEAERQRADGRRIVVYPATRWAYAVYGSAGFEPVDADNETGFDVEIAAPEVVVLGPHRAEPERYVPELERATAGADVITFIASHWRDDIQVIDTWFPDRGWIEARRVERPGARLVEWRRG